MNNNIPKQKIKFKAKNKKWREQCIKGFINKSSFGTSEKSELKKFKNVNFLDNINTAIKDSDLIIIHTEWNEFKTINFKKEVKNKKMIIFDMRNIYSLTKMKEQKIKYFAIGR